MFEESFYKTGGIANIKWPWSFNSVKGFLIFSVSFSKIHHLHLDIPCNEDVRKNLIINMMKFFDLYLSFNIIKMSNVFLWFFSLNHFSLLSFVDFLLMLRDLIVSILPLPYWLLQNVLKFCLLNCTFFCELSQLSIKKRLSIFQMQELVFEAMMPFAQNYVDFLNKKKVTSLTLIMFSNTLLFSLAYSAFNCWLSLLSFNSASLSSCSPFLFKNPSVYCWTSSSKTLILSISFCLFTMSTLIWSLFCLRPFNSVLVYFFSSYVPLSSFLSMRFKWIFSFLNSRCSWTFEYFSRLFNLDVFIDFIDLFLS